MKLKPWLLAIVILPASVRAQTPADVLPGSSAINAEVLKPARWSMIYTMSRGGQTAPEIRLDYELARAEREGKPVWLFIQTVNSPRGIAIDSSWVDARTLAAIAHRGNSPMRTLTLDFHGKMVHGEHKQGTDAKMIHSEVAQELFDSSILDLLVTTLPLANGYQARLPVYIYEQGGLVWQNVSVIGDDANAWKVKVDSGNGTVVTYAIDKKTRMVLNGEMVNAAMTVNLRRAS
jgi:hypothetical protein